MNEYNALLQSTYFKAIESFSNAFIKRHENGVEFSKYKHTWVVDPFHWWSRVWEYPYVIDRVRSRLTPEARVLDVGSGVTFLPFLLSALEPGAVIHASDTNRMYPAIYDEINAIEPLGRNVSFTLITDASKPHAADNYYDIIYCVSVLEHVGDWTALENTVSIIARQLKAGGLFVVTFDIKPGAVISPDTAGRMLDVFRKYLVELDTRYEQTASIQSQTWQAIDHVDVQRVYLDEFDTRASWGIGRGFAPLLTFNCHSFVKSLS